MGETTFRRAGRDELDLAVDWAAGEGWNPGLADAAAFWATDPDGFVCAERDGDVIATGSVVSYDGDFGFMGFFIVRPDLRGHGIGREFWFWRRDRLVARLRPGAAVGMDGVFAMQPFYRSGGFEFAHRTLRMTGPAPRRSAGSRVRVVDAGELPFEEVVAFDQAHFGFDRRRFLRAWIAPAGGRAVAATDGGRTVGLGVIRPCREAFKIGPLFAADERVAEAIFLTLASVAEGSEVTLDVPEVNAEAMDLAERSGLVERFGCARMYLGAAPPIPWHRVYGVTTFELG